MQLASSAFQHNQTIPSKYTCDGANVNPPLQISRAKSGRDGAQPVSTLALIVDDPDAPGGDFVHWIMWNIDPGTTAILENTLPAAAIEGLTDFGTTGYGGPCPPSGTHRYQFKLFALDTALALTSKAKKADLLKAMEGHILDQTVLIGLYKRKSP